MDEYSSSPALLFLQKFGLVILLGVLGFGSLVYGLIQYIPRSENNTVTFDEAQINVSPPATEKLMVDVSGAVMKPGVYSFEVGSRIADAIEKAGGLSKSADQSYIAKTVNGAMKLTDGMKIYIPKVGESAAKTITSDTTGGSGTVLGAQTGLISINTASPAQLDSLPGVGEVTAGKIIAGRPYGEVSELLSRKVVSSSVYEKIKDKISL